MNERRPVEEQRLLAELAGVRAAMEHRAVIEQAKGIVMATMGCDPDHAFEVLVSQSKRENRKLRDVAVDLVGLQSCQGRPPAP